MTKLYINPSKVKKIKLGILDQSIVTHGKTASDAVKETIATAKLAEELGYTRFWVSEHHNSPFIAGSTPEVLMVKLADEFGWKVGDTIPIPYSGCCHVFSTLPYKN